MKIALVHSFYASDSPSGENDVVLAQLSLLKRRGHEVKLFARYTDDLRGRFGYQISSGVRTAVGFENELLPQIQAFRPDVVHVHNLFPNFGISWMAKCQYPIVATLHNFRIMCANGTLAREGSPCFKCPTLGSVNAVIHQCYRQSTVASIPLAIATRRSPTKSPQVKNVERTIVISRRSAEIFESFGVSRNQMAIIPNFVEKSPIATEPRPNEWCFVGRLSEEKGVGKLIESWPEGHKLFIYGDGPLRQFVVENQSDWIVYGGSLPKSGIQSTIAQTQGLIFPSLWAEAGPTIVYLEALAAARPAIALRGNGVADDISEAGTGVVLDSFGQLESALTKVSSSSEYGRNAAQRFLNEFSEEVWWERMHGLYLEVIQEYSEKRRNT